MNFNSVVFLFCFMPLALGLYYLVPGRVKNAVLLVESLLFFCWGGITWLPLAVGMVAINYAAGLLLASLPAGGKRKIVLIAAIVLTAAALVPHSEMKIGRPSFRALSIRSRSQAPWVPA